MRYSSKYFNIIRFAVMVIFRLLIMSTGLIGGHALTQEAAPKVQVMGQTDEPTSTPAWRKSLQSQPIPCVDMKLTNQPIEMVVALLADAAKRTIMLGDGARSRTVTAFFVNTPVDQALRSFADAQQLCIVRRESCILLVSRQEYLSNFAKTEIIPLKHANPEALAKILQTAQKGELLEVSCDERTRSLIFRGDPEQICNLREAAFKLDHSLQSQVFIIHYAAVNVVAKAFCDSLGIEKESIGSVVPDERTNRLIVQESPENLALCGEIIKSLDIPVETRVFSTGNLDPTVVGDQIKKGELGGGNRNGNGNHGNGYGNGNGNGSNGSHLLSSNATVQPVDGTNQIIVTDTLERLNNLEKVMEELNRNVITEVIRPQNATPKEIADVLKGAFNNVNINTDPRTGSLIVIAHKSIVKQVEDLVRKLDEEKNIRVEIEAKIMLVSTEKINEYGTRFYGQNLGAANETLANVGINPNFLADNTKPSFNSNNLIDNAVSEMGNPAGGPITNPIKSSSNYLGVIQPNIQVQALVRALESDSGTKLLSNPRLQTLNGEIAHIFAGSNEPYTDVTLQNTQSVSNTKFINVGLTFDVTPWVSPSNDVILDVSTDFSTLQALRNGVPVTDDRKAESMVEAKNGETLLLGGLISEQTNNQGGGIPFLCSIPVIKYFFSDKQKDSTQMELVIVITPRVLKRTHKELLSIDSLPKGYDMIHQEFSKDAKQKDANQPKVPQKQ